MDSQVFFDHVRSSLFRGSLTVEQVQGMEALISAAVAYPVKDVRHLAYILGGVYHEVGARMVPVREGFAKTDAGARAAVKKLFDRGVISRNYALPVNGVSYYGRGRIQNTHLANYQKLEKRFGKPFVSEPDLLLQSAIDAEVTVAGHMEGIWTGKSLSDYINGAKCDYRGARRIVNGTDKAALIAGYAEKFEAALKAADYGEADPQTPTRTVDPAPEPEAVTVTTGTTKAAAGAGIIGAIAAALYAAWEWIF
jgi:predicted chitinase